MKEIPAYSSIYKDKIILVDDEDYDKVVLAPRSGRWTVFIGGTHNIIYYAHAWCLVDNKPKKITLHRFVLDFPIKNIDHKNGNGLDVQKDNLRLCEHHQNMSNRSFGYNKDDSILYKGVSHKRRKYKSTLKYKYKQCGLGVYTTQEEAAYAYDIAATLLKGEFAYINYIPAPNNKELIEEQVKFWLKHHGVWYPPLNEVKL